VERLVFVHRVLLACKNNGYRWQLSYVMMWSFFRHYVDDQDACLVEALAGRGFARPKLWETAENAYSLEGIGPEDKYGVIKDVQVRSNPMYHRAHLHHKSDLPLWHCDRHL
jgi:hypothetical protein